MLWDVILEIAYFLRHINPYLGTVALVALGFRLGPALVFAKMSGQDRAARFLFAGYILAAVIGGAQSIFLNNTVTLATPLLTALHVGVITLMIRWKNPHPLKGTES